MITFPTVALLDPDEWARFLQLPEYSCSVPSGFQVGKRWRADREGRHWLCEFVQASEPLVVRRMAWMIPALATVEIVKSTDGRPGYWLARHRNRTVTFAGSVYPVVQQLWIIDGDTWKPEAIVPAVDPTHFGVVKPDEMVLARVMLAAGAYGNAHADGFAHERAGLNEKRACAIYDKWTARGWADYGVSLRTAFLTHEGAAALQLLLEGRCVVCGHLFGVHSPDKSMPCNVSGCSCEGYDTAF